MARAGKIKPQLINQSKRAFLARVRKEWLLPVFTWVDWRDNELANKINKIAEFDAWTMKKDARDAQLLGNIFDYWVWIRVYDGENNISKNPRRRVIDPLCWFPDPVGNGIDQNWDYHFFLFNGNKDELEAVNEQAEEEIYFDIDQIQNWPNLDIKDISKKRQRGISDQITYRDRAFLTIAYANLNGRKYRATLANNRTLIVRWEEIEAISKDEEENPSIVPFSISVSYAMPCESDPFGYSVREFLIDKEDAMIKIVNALFYKELQNAGNDTYLFDTTIVNNPHLLGKRAEDGKIFIPANPWNKSLEQAIAQVSTIQNTTQQYNFFDFLRNLGETDSGISSTMLGAWVDKSETLWQSQMLAGNTDENMSFDFAMIGIGEEAFWRNIYYRSFVKNLKKYKKKIINISWSYDDFVKIELSEFIGSKDPNIAIKSTQELIKENKAKSIILQSLIPLVQSSWGKLPLNITIYYRELMRLGMLDDSFIYSIFPKSPDEIHAERMQKIINIWVRPKSLFIAGVDPYALLFYVSNCVENEIKQEAISQINSFILESRKNWLEQTEKQQASESKGNTAWVANSMASQMISNNLAQNNNNGGTTTQQ